MKRRTFLKILGFTALTPIISPLLDYSYETIIETKSVPLSEANFVEILDKRLREVAEDVYSKMPSLYPELFRKA